MANFNNITFSNFKLIGEIGAILLGPYCLMKIFKNKIEKRITFKNLDNSIIKSYSWHNLNKKFYKSEEIQRAYKDNFLLFYKLKKIEKEEQLINMSLFKNNFFIRDAELPLISIFCIDYNFYFLHYFLVSYLCFAGYIGILLILFNILDKINPFILSVFFLL